LGGGRQPRQAPCGPVPELHFGEFLYTKYSSINIFSSYPPLHSPHSPCHLPSVSCMYPIPLHTRPPRCTCYVRRSVLILVAPDPQLAIPVGAPALDPTPGRDRARVFTPCSYGDGGETCEGMCEYCVVGARFVWCVGSVSGVSEGGPQAQWSTVLCRQLCIAERNGIMKSMG
jgi:hypothetical protein